MRNKLLISLLLAGACAQTEDQETDVPEIEVAEDGSFAPRAGLIDNFTFAGQRMTVIEFVDMHFATQRIAACGHGVLYASRTDNTLWVNTTQGFGAWTQVTAGTKGWSIACDRSHLYSKTSGGTLYHALTRFDGQLVTPADGSAVWKSTQDGQALSLPAGTDEIQGGNGNIYALATNSSGVSTLYSSQLWNPTKPTTQGTAGSWIQLANNLGSAKVTGAGSKITYTGYLHDGLTYRKRNRMFGVNPDDTLYYNDSMLYGQNLWRSMPNAGLNITSITAEGPDVLWALTVGATAGSRRLVRFSFTETSCSDNLDNDADGETDAEDRDCQLPLAKDWCSTKSAGTTYCMDRIDARNPNALVTCRGASTPTIDEGVCTRGSTAGTDFLASARANTPPSGTGQYCNIHNADGTWDFAWTGSDPCATLLSRNPTGAVIVRAGLYSTTGENSIAIKCSNGGVVDKGLGTAPLIAMNDAVGHTANRCVVTVSPRQLRVFQSPIVTGAWSSFGNRGYAIGHIYDHIPSCVAGDANCPCSTTTCPMSMEQFGNGDINATGRIDMQGKFIPVEWNAQNAYDYWLDEGTPLKSLGYGTVVTSRDRDIRGPSGPGTAFQGEVYIEYHVGSSTRYRETFIAYYGHVSKRSVVNGQTVKPGQLIGYSGTTGSSTGPHLHFGLLRLSNTNGRLTGEPARGHQFGYHVPFETLDSDEGRGYGFNDSAFPGAVDPYGWRAPTGIDPMGYLLGKAETDGGGGVIGMGAWSPAVWIGSEEPPYPGL